MALDEAARPFATFTRTLSTPMGSSHVLPAVLYKQPWKVLPNIIQTIPSRASFLICLLAFPSHPPKKIKRPNRRNICDKKRYDPIPKSRWESMTDIPGQGPEWRRKGDITTAHKTNSRFASDLFEKGNSREVTTLDRRTCNEKE